MRHRISVVLFVAWLVPSLAQAQEEQDATETEGDRPAEPRAINTPKIGRRIEGTFRELQAMQPLLRKSPEAWVVEQNLARFARTVEHLDNAPELDDLDSLSPRALRYLQQEWMRLEGQLQEWQGGLEDRSAAIAEARRQASFARRTWELTLAAPRDEPLPASQHERIEALLERIDHVIHRLARRQSQILSLQARLSDQGIRVAAMNARLDSAIERARARRSRPDTVPLWRGVSGDPLQWPLEAVRAASQEHHAELLPFVVRYGRSLLIQGGAMIAFAALLLWLRRRLPIQERNPPTRGSPVQALHGRPIAVAVFFAALPTPFLYPYAPVLVLDASMILLIASLARIVPVLVPANRRALVLVLALGALALLLDAVPPMSGWRRIAVLVLAIAATLALGWTLVLRRREVAALDRGWRRLFSLARIALVPLVAAVWFNAWGYLARADLWTLATLASLVYAVALLAAVILARTLSTIAVRRPMLRWFHIVREHPEAVLLHATRLLKWSAVALWVVFTLLAFDLSAPAFDMASEFLATSFRFGAIELSVAELLAFASVILGTFLLVRLVHFVLDVEILPRMGFGKDVAPAISLTVRYLLVALGVVLAFGAAGVDPSSLALLGGALGVGIGFGLQNVVSNFVSGLILLAERPVKVGDYVQLGSLVGRVRRIGIRSSTVHSTDGAEVIVPNSDLISAQLINWTLSDSRRRVEVVIGIDLDQAPQRVLRVLERVVRSEPLALANPAPSVLIRGFGEAGIDYVIYAWAADFLGAGQLKSKLTIGVHDALAREQISLPGPQRELHVRSVSEQVVRVLGQVREPPPQARDDAPNDAGA